MVEKPVHRCTALCIMLGEIYTELTRQSTREEREHFKCTDILLTRFRDVARITLGEAD